MGRYNYFFCPNAAMVCDGGGFFHGPHRGVFVNGQIPGDMGGKF